jgi:hypothetical protein
MAGAPRKLSKSSRRRARFQAAGSSPPHRCRFPPGLALDDRALLARSGSRATALPPRAGQPRRRSIGRSGRPGALLPGRGVPVAAAYHDQAARPHGPGRAGGAGAGRARPTRGPRRPDAAGEAKAAGLVAAAERYEARFFAWHPQAEGIRAALRHHRRVRPAAAGPGRRGRFRLHEPHPDHLAVADADHRIGVQVPRKCARGRATGPIRPLFLTPRSRHGSGGRATAARTLTVR